MIRATSRRWWPFYFVALLLMSISAWLAIGPSYAQERPIAAHSSHSSTTESPSVAARRAAQLRLLEPQKIPDSQDPQARSVLEAARTKTHPERLGVMSKPNPFNAKTFAKNPHLYLDVAEPGRVWDVAEPGKGVIALEPASPLIVDMAALATTRLAVVGKPNAPVTFTSFDLGRFQNGLTTITVRADEKGWATAEFAASEGTVEYVSVLAGSPEASGQVQFSIQVASQGVQR